MCVNRSGGGVLGHGNYLCLGLDRGGLSYCRHGCLGDSFIQAISIHQSIIHEY